MSRGAPSGLNHRLVCTGIRGKVGTRHAIKHIKSALLLQQLCLAALLGPSFAWLLLGFSLHCIPTFCFISFNAFHCVVQEVGNLHLL